MSEKLVQLSLDDYEETMRFMNMVFAVYGPMNFAEFLPKLYQPTEEHMHCNWAVKRNGEIRAAIGLFPMTMHLGETILDARGIGGVSVHPDDRGRGYMQKLMHHCLNLMREEKVQLTWLSGHRQRYGYFGYEIGGVKYQFSMQTDNMRHALGRRALVRFERIDKNDSSWLQKSAALQKDAFLRVDRSRHLFYDILCGWRNEPYAALNEHGEFVGYVVANGEGTLINEIFGVSHDSILDILSSWIAEKETAIIIETPPLRSPLTITLAQMCESWSSAATGNWRIFDWTGVLSTALAAKNHNTPLINGSARIEIKDAGCFELVVDGARTLCRPTFAAPDFSCDEKSAISLFFHAMPADLATPSIPANSILRQWLPLPLTLSKQDEV